MVQSDYSIIVFSFNRGAHLQNCVSSIERHAPQASLRIIDDCSDDALTREVLDSLAVKHEVTLMDAAGKAQASKVGGLYRNMQRALDDLPDARLFSFFQDDMQMVRDLEARDIAAMRNFFDIDERNAFLGHVFMRGYRRQKLGPTIRYDSRLQGYVRQPGNADWGSYFAAIHTSRSDRLRNTGFRYAGSEKRNGFKARDMFNVAPTLRDPFATCLPAVPVHRYKANTWSQRLAGRLERAGLYRVVPMTPAEVANFRQRDPIGNLPWSEDFLRTDPPAPQLPWTYSGFQGRRWLKHLNRLEVELGKLRAAGAIAQRRGDARISRRK